jgi:hypothetical protein
VDIWRFKFNSLPINVRLSNVDHTIRELSLRSHYLSFLTCKVFQNKVRLTHSHGHPKCVMPPKNLFPRYSMFSISPF